MLRLSVGICSRRARNNFVIQPRQFVSDATGQIPGFIKPILQYASDAYGTRAIQAGIEAIHSLDFPWVTSFVFAGAALRLFTAPAHIMAERWYAKRLHLTNYLTQQLVKKVSERHKIPVVVDPKTYQPKFSHHDPLLNIKAHAMVNTALNSYFKDQGLQKPRIMLMKVTTLPVWIFSSFAIRNILQSDFGTKLSGFWWVNNFIEPDPYFVFPIAVGLCAFLNFYSQRILFPSKPHTSSLKVYDGVLSVSICLGVYILSNMPACISLYWLTVSVTGIIQSLLLRHPRVKQALGIQRLPWDSKTPFRDLFLLRKRQLSAI